MSTVMAAYRMDTEGFSQIKACLEKGGWELKKERADNESLSLEYENKGYKYLLTEYKQKELSMKLLAKNKFNIKILLIYFALSLCFLYTFGGFMRDNIIFNPNEVKLGRQCMLFNLKRLDLLKSNVMEEYTFNRYTRFF